MVMEAKRFFDSIRASLFGGRLTKAQVAGIEAILVGAASYPAQGDERQLAYMLGTTYHETARRMVPVRETLAPSDDEAIRRLDKAYEEGRLAQVKLPYWRKDAEGKSWLGRGLVQITHKRNYQLMSVVTGYNLVRNPDMALDPRVAVEVLVRGMQQGCFTGYKLSDFFNPHTCDWIGARKIINGNERAEEVAKVSEAFFVALRSASIEPKAA